MQSPPASEEALGAAETLDFKQAGKSWQWEGYGAEGCIDLLYVLRATLAAVENVSPEKQSKKSKTS